jgi:hypothetical protein
VELLGSHFDIHGGGMDLKFPHHENEIAQTCAAGGSKFVNVWMHNGFVRVDDEKMSKSLGNFFTVREVQRENGFNELANRMMIRVGLDKEDAPEEVDTEVPVPDILPPSDPVHAEMIDMAPYHAKRCVELQNFDGLRPVYQRLQK